MDQGMDALEVRRDDLRTTRLARDPLTPLGDGQLLLRVERFGLTANNVSYGAAADLVGYWDFFPTADGWGRIPVWGFADVAAGAVEGLPVGTRVFGYLPMATHLVVEPTRVSGTGFTDGRAHRAHLPAVYNRYRTTTADPLHDEATEDLQAIFFPLFVTSFLIDDYLADHGDFGAARVIISSASSKTAAGTALCASRREGPRPRVVGLTSPSRVGVVEGLGCYDAVVAYGEIASLDPSVRSVFVDVAGDAKVREAVHRHVGDRLAASITVGMTHWEAVGTSDGLPGPQPELFFAPSQIEKRLRDWGREGYGQRLATAWAALVDVAGDWVEIVELDGLDALRDAYLRMVDGDVDPTQALIVRMR
jgi:Protein of unknown function (DUF2855)